VGAVSGPDELEAGFLLLLLRVGGGAGLCGGWSGPLSLGLFNIALCCRHDGAVSVFNPGFGLWAVFVITTYVRVLLNDTANTGKKEGKRKLSLAARW
jgi:hypothetical protein